MCHVGAAIALPLRGVITSSDGCTFAAGVIAKNYTVVGQ